MSLLLILCFVAPIACSVQVLPLTPAPTLVPPKPYYIDSQTLDNVFGSPLGSAPLPPNSALVDPDYWDSVDDFRPSSTNYDMFDWTLTKRVAAYSNDNFLLSPLSLKLALAILTEASTMATQAELQAVLGFDPDRMKVRSKFSTILASLQTKSSQYDLDLGSRIYVEKSATPRQRFAAIAEEFYRTELRNIDFGDVPAAAKEINDWVANVTRGKISNLVNAGDVSQAVVLLLNTVYFKGTWRQQFAPNATIVAPFYQTPLVQKPAQFMKLHSHFYYAESPKLDAKILRLPYLGHKFSMYIVVPNSLTGLPRVLAGVDDLRSEMLYLKECVVNLSLPRFTFEHSTQLDGVLKEMGIRQAFEDTASFPGIARGQTLTDKLHVSRVLQRSGVDVNELGSEAYAATAISLENKFGEDMDVIQEVVANRPFLFFIEDEATRQLLFTGRLSTPPAPAPAVAPAPSPAPNPAPAPAAVSG